MKFTHPVNTTIDNIDTGDDTLVAEIKYDGERTQVWNGDLINRNDQLKTEHFPELHDTLQQLPDGIVLDGEIIIPTDNQPYGQFRKILQRNTRDDFKRKLLAKSSPAQLILFDILHTGNTDVRNKPYSFRRNILKTIIQHTPDNIKLARRFDDIDQAWAHIKDQDAEGIIVKQRGSPYTGGRTPAWKKIKNRNELQTAAASYKEHSKGIVVTTEDGHDINVNGRQARRLKQAIDNDDAPALEVEYLEKTDSGSLRQPTVKRVDTGDLL